MHPWWHAMRTIRDVRQPRPGVLTDGFESGGERRPMLLGGCSEAADGAKARSRAALEGFRRSNESVSGAVLLATLAG